jgi:hypothetical protein
VDLTTLGMLAFFGAGLAGIALGFLVGWLTVFELGLGIGLLLPGVVGLGFAARCLGEYREFTAPGALRAAGEVIEVRDEAVTAGGGVTRPVPIVRFTARDGGEHTVRGPASGAMKAGDRVTVLYAAGDPSRARAAKVSELRGGAIAFMLFGTFPMTVGLWFGIGGLIDRVRPPRRLIGGPPAPGRRRWPVILALNLLLVAGIVLPGVLPGELPRAMALGFGVVALAMAGHAVRGLLDPATSLRWAFGMLVLAVNFSAWAWALWLLTGGSDWS